MQYLEIPIAYFTASPLTSHFQKCAPHKCSPMSAPLIEQNWETLYHMTLQTHSGLDCHHRESVLPLMTRRYISVIGETNLKCITTPDRVIIWYYIISEIHVCSLLMHLSPIRLGRQHVMCAVGSFFLHWYYYWNMH